MVERMTSQGGVVGFNIDAEFVFKAILFQEAVDSGGVIVILVLGRLLRLWLNQQHAFETDFVLVFNDHLHKTAQLLTLLAQIGIE